MRGPRRVVVRRVVVRDLVVRRVVVRVRVVVGVRGLGVRPPRVVVSVSGSGLGEGVRGVGPRGVVGPPPVARALLTFAQVSVEQPRRVTANTKIFFKLIKRVRKDITSYSHWQLARVSSHLVTFCHPRVRRQ